MEFVPVGACQEPFFGKGEEVTDRYNICLAFILNFWLLHVSKGPSSSQKDGVVTKKGQLRGEARHPLRPG